MQPENRFPFFGIMVSVAVRPFGRAKGDLTR
jgi:hypothetical protein